MRRFKKGGRGWKNPFRQEQGKGVRDELKTQEQVRLCQRLPLP